MLWNLSGSLMGMEGERSYLEVIGSIYEKGVWQAKAWSQGKKIKMRHSIHHSLSEDQLLQEPQSGPQCPHPYNSRSNPSTSAFLLRPKPHGIPNLKTLANTKNLTWGSSASLGTRVTRVPGIQYGTSSSFPTRNITVHCSYLHGTTSTMSELRRIMG